MESKEYFEKVMQDYNQNRNGRSLRKYCKDETPKPKNWQVEKLILMSPDGDSIEIKSSNMFVVTDMLLILLEDDQSPKARLEFRKKWSKQIVGRLMDMLKGSEQQVIIAIERCFRHIAMGRRNWQQTGSHFAAQNISFMFGLLESCILNKVNLVSILRMYLLAYCLARKETSRFCHVTMFAVMKMARMLSSLKHA